MTRTEILAEAKQCALEHLDQDTAQGLIDAYAEMSRALLSIGRHITDPTGYRCLLDRNTRGLREWIEAIR